MRCKAQRICEIIRGRYHRDPLNADVYMFMSEGGENEYLYIKFREHGNIGTHRTHTQTEASSRDDGQTRKGAYTL